jgi:hypothetical protein
VDMTLQPPAWSLDDASASPTCPPRQPQQAFDAEVDPDLRTRGLVGTMVVPS